jgi:hypothetical protein
MPYKKSDRLQSDHEARYLIIAGTTKAGTTSLFNYLADHPQICAASWKESRFFLDSDYPVRRHLDYSAGLETYQRIFRFCDAGQIRLEATPDYLYSAGTPQRIHAALRNVQLIFILREPVSRLVSWYRFARQRNLIPTAMNLEDYVQLQLDGTAPPTQPFLALEQGRYFPYLQRYCSTFDKEQILLLFFEQLSANPLSAIQSICKFTDCDAGFYTDYSFVRRNQSIEIRNPYLYSSYLNLVHSLSAVTKGLKIHAVLKDLRQKTERNLLSLWEVKSETAVLPPNAERILVDYYWNANEALEHWLGGELPSNWNRAS